MTPKSDAALARLGGPSPRGIGAPSAWAAEVAARHRDRVAYRELLKVPIERDGFHDRAWLEMAAPLRARLGKTECHLAMRWALLDYRRRALNVCVREDCECLLCCSEEEAFEGLARAVAHYDGTWRVSVPAIPAALPP